MTHDFRAYHSIVCILVCTILGADSVDDVYTKAYLLKQNGQFLAAIPYYQTVLKHDPYHVHAHIGYAQALLATGNYEQGFAELEWRLGSPWSDTIELKEHLQKNRMLHNRIVVIEGEWGIGDCIMMLGFVRLLKERGATIILRTNQKPLVPLLQLQPYIDQVIDHTTQTPPCHWRIPLMSLPNLFPHNICTTHHAAPSLTIDCTQKTFWHDYLKTDTQFKIGICWHGNTIHGEEKFMPLRYFLALNTIAGVSLYSLQRLHGIDQIAQVAENYALKQFPEPFDVIPFFDTIAIMQELDLIITVDTSLAHLAGSLGCPVWVVLHFPAEWRWMTDRHDTPWYPTMRLFRKQKNCSWDHVAQQLIAAVTTKMGCP